MQLVTMHVTLDLISLFNFCNVSHMNATFRPANDSYLSLIMLNSILVGLEVLRWYSKLI